MAIGGDSMTDVAAVSPSDMQQVLRAARLVMSQKGWQRRRQLMPFWEEDFLRVKIGAVAFGDIDPDSFGVVDIWRVVEPENGLPELSDPIETLNVWLDWAHGDEKISEGKQVIIGWFPECERWRVIAAECEDAPAPAPAAFNPLVLSATTLLYLSSNDWSTYQPDGAGDVNSQLDLSGLGNDVFIGANSAPKTRVDSSGIRWLDFTPTASLKRGDALGLTGASGWTIALVADLDDYAPGAGVARPLLSIGDSARGAGKYLEISLESGAA
jgi:hypothetical protein